VPFVEVPFEEAGLPVWAMAAAAKMATTAVARILKVWFGFGGWFLVEGLRERVNECSWKLEVFKIASWV